MEYPVPVAQWEQATSAMCASMERGWEPPPLIVEYRGSVLSLRDGNHRHGALLQRGTTHYWAIFWFNDDKDRQEFVATYAANFDVS